MRDTRDYLIAGLFAALLFCVGLLLGQQVQVLPSAEAQGTNGTGGGGPPPQIPANGTPQPPFTPPRADPRPGLEGRTAASRPSDSDSNNRFVAVTCPTNTGESVLFLIDSYEEQIAVYRFKGGQGLEYLSSRKIEYDLKVSGYKDTSEFSYEQMRELFQQQVARQAAKGAGK
jgi:hypothetical protein